MIKSILGGKSKNLFDISKAEITQHNVYWTSNADFTQHFYTQIVEPGKTYTVSYEYYNPLAGNDALSLSVQTGSGFYEGTRLYTGLIGNGKYEWVKQHGVFTIPNGVTQVTLSAFYDTMFRNLQIELGSTATEYVPHELTSYKSIMKVSDVCQLLDKSKYPATHTTNGITFTNNGDGSFTVDGTISSGLAVLPVARISNLIVGHKYYSSSSKYKNGVYVETKIDRNNANTIWQSGIIHEWVENDTTMYISLLVDSHSANTVENAILVPQLFDLTEMFGPGNEPKTVAEFKAKFPNDYYPYSPSCFVTSFDERMPCKTKNLFSSSTEVGTLEGGFGGPTVARNFEENKWYQGFTTNGYYGPGNVLDFDIHPNSLYVYSKGAGYGMSRAIKCEPNTEYFISCSYSHISGGEGNVYVGYYDEGGNFISNLNMDMKYKFVITTPSNCKWLIINFTTQGVGKVYFSDIQLVKGSTATDYVPYGYV